jgi:hypothetical protein
MPKMMMPAMPLLKRAEHVKKPDSESIDLAPPVSDIERLLSQET